MSCHLMSSQVKSSQVKSSQVKSSHVMSCHVMSSHLISSHLISSFGSPESCSRLFLPSLLNSSIRAAGWQRRGFRNRGPVRESGSERRSRSGAACTASVRVWCGAFFSRLRGAAGVPRACRGAVPWGLGSGRVLCTHGGQRAFRVAGCGDRACVAGMPRAVSAAPCREDWCGRVALRPFRVAGVDSGCMSALGTRGRCGARWLEEVSRRWIRVAGVERARSVRFAWQA